MSEDMLARARELVPSLRDRAALTAELRRVPDETIEDFRRAGFYRILQPKRHGGMELDYGTQTELAIELARGCASSAWDASITACHSWLVGMYGPETQDEVWGADPEAMISTSFRPMGIEASAEDDGIRISGRWKFSSGVDHCDWAILAFDVKRDGMERPDPVLALVPLSDCRVDDTWFASGLTGTGSNDIVVEGVIVPAHRVLRVMELRGDPTPGSLAGGRYIYRLPLHGVFSFNIIGTAIGAARCAMESVIDGLRDHSSVTHVNVAEQPSVRLRISESRAAADAAQALVRQNLDEIARLGEAGEVPSLEQRVRYRSDNGFAAKLCVQSVGCIYPLLGARGLSEDDPANRAWRDVHAVTNHIALTWDLQGPLHAIHALGFPIPDPKI